MTYAQVLGWALRSVLQRKGHDLQRGSRDEQRGAECSGTRGGEIQGVSTSFSRKVWLAVHRPCWTLLISILLQILAAALKLLGWMEDLKGRSDPFKEAGHVDHRSLAR